MLEIERAKANLIAQMSHLKKEKELHTSKLEKIKNLPKLPRDPKMRANNGGVPLRKGQAKPAASTLTWTSGSRTNDALVRARREAKEIGKMARISRPTHTLNGPIRQITKAPTGMIREYKVATQPTSVRIYSPLAKRRSAENKQGPLSTNAIRAREARLLQAKNGIPPASNERKKIDSDGKFIPPSYVSSSDEDDSAPDGLDDLFDEKPDRPQMGAGQVNPQTATYSSQISVTQRQHTGPSVSTYSTPPSVSTLPKKPNVVSAGSKLPAIAQARAVLEPNSTRKASPSQISSQTVASSSPPRRQNSPIGASKPFAPQARPKKPVDVFMRRPAKKPRLN